MKLYIANAIHFVWVTIGLSFIIIFGLWFLFLFIKFLVVPYLVPTAVILLGVALFLFICWGESERDYNKKKYKAPLR